APQQRKRQVSACVLAGLLFIVITLQFPLVIRLSIKQAVFITVAALILLPLLQAFSRRLLTRTSVWANEVVILGAGQGGSRIANSLSANPLIGYKPVAFFDDDVKKHGTTIHGVPVVG